MRNYMLIIENLHYLTNNFDENISYPLLVSTIFANNVSEILTYLHMNFDVLICMSEIHTHTHTHTYGQVLAFNVCPHLFGFAFLPNC